ncbi:MAG TPA: hypothetical protein VGG34_06190 [Opitutaceae bacterium]|jgi:hypothetical protein
MSDSPAIAKSAVRFAKWRDAAGFLPSELTTVALVLLVAARFYYTASFSPSDLIGGLVLWALVACGVEVARAACDGRPAVELGILKYGLGPALIAAAARAAVGNLSWAQAGAIGTSLALSLIAVRALLAFPRGYGKPAFSDGLRVALVQCVAAYAIHPYAICAQVGLGDAYHYTLSLADAVHQLRAGVFPIFVGQSRFAFNGGIHTLRTAPYFTHLGFILDAATLHTLPAFALCNLILLFSTVVGAVSAYSALLVYSPNRPWLDAALAALFILSPAILASLYEGDMIPTFIAMPMIPWLALGLALAAEDPSGWRPWLYQSVAVAALWWAHPPTALWASILCAGGVLAAVARRRMTRIGLARMTLAALLFALLAAYEFTSVLTLRLPPGPDTQATEATDFVQKVSSRGLAPFEPLSTDGGHLNGDVQLGYSLLLAIIAGLLVSKRLKSANTLFGLILFLIAFIVPLPGATRWLWLHVPKIVLDVTKFGPKERFYPLLAGLAIFVSVAGLSQLDLARRRRAVFLSLGLSAAVAWSGFEATRLFKCAVGGSFSPESSTQHFSPANLVLTRVSYMFFGFFPGYFSNSPTEPFLETRLLDAHTLGVISDGETSFPDSAVARGPSLEFSASSNDTSELRIPLKPEETAVLRFDFLGREPRGELQLESRTLDRLYALPSSGGEKAFGAGPRNGRLIAITNSSKRPDLLNMRFVPDRAAGDGRGAPGPFARVTITPFVNDGHALTLRSLMPFNVDVHSDREGILETPRVDIPGYHATVNGAEVGIVKTADGLVGVPVPPGTSNVHVFYPGPRILRVTYWMSLASWIMMGVCLGTFPLAIGREKRRRFASVLDAFISRLVVPVLAAIAIGAGLTVSIRAFSGWVKASGNLRVVVRLPAEPAGTIEPLVTTGRTGRGDVIFIKFLGGDHVSVGYDHWGFGGTVSKPIKVDFAQPQSVEISMRSLSRRSILGIGGPDVMPTGIRVEWNGREVISAARDSYSPGPLEIGVNSIGASSCGPRFNGEILAVDRPGTAQSPAAPPREGR